MVYFHYLVKYRHLGNLQNPFSVDFHCFEAFKMEMLLNKMAMENPVSSKSFFTDLSASVTNLKDDRLAINKDLVLIPAIMI